MEKDFLDKVILVTGAGSGIGREAARLFATRGALVYAIDLNVNTLEETGHIISSEGGQTRLVNINVSQESEVSALLIRIDSEVGRLDGALNNAGITGGTYRIENYPSEDFDHVISVNLRSVFLGMKYQLPLIKRTGGTIVNTASVAALTGPGGMCAYAASKHGVLGLTRVAAMENAAHGIRINAIAPGWTETPMVIANSAQNPAFADLLKESIPAKRGAHPAEIAEAAVWMSSHAASYLHGQMLILDGGMTVGGFEA
ncbi:short-chain dehydrogenase [Enterobacter cloacae]|uniref:SDR family NAD(P)-dependent oxidoreductase n=1 Tax=Enterobacter cloacae TaxID=550 RepID=UPI000BA8C758|nr:SDR family NAD(P)-dependent oxidoreductase [Enterobacter cloacae]MDW3563476.1 SDR family oxidoreductase [Enterobacter cloacae]PAN76416.1 short-chain dehydrogenase [Enterobacter cloacae]WNJ09272.1 SDR family NAD(P)-dependent oxidoreductase [Enterobacter cloacae]